MAANDTSATLLTFRGWALHDRTTLAFRRQPLPPLDGEIAGYQAPFTHPLLDFRHGFADRPGYYAKLDWQPPVPVRVELFRYDNRADPEAVNQDLEWGWRTRFNHVGLVGNLGGGASAQGCRRSRAARGWAIAEAGGRRWIDNRFRSAFVLLTRPFGPFGLAARVEALRHAQPRQRLSTTNMTTRAGRRCSPRKRDWGRFTGLVELLHVSSRREQRAELGLAAAPAPDPAPGRTANALVTTLAAPWRLPFALNPAPWCVDSWFSRRALASRRRLARPRCRCASSTLRAACARCGRHPLSRGGAARPATAAGRYVVSQKNIQFHPFLTIVPVGADVSFPNFDPTKHHVYSFSPAKRFELKLFAKDQSRTVHFDKPGVVALGCNIHDQMSAFIVVTDSAWTARTNAQGMAVFADAPERTGRVTVWHPYLRAPGGAVQQAIGAGAAQPGLRRPPAAAAAMPMTDY